MSTFYHQDESIYLWSKMLAHKTLIFFLESLNAWRFLLVALKVCIFLFNTFSTYLVYFIHLSLVSIFYCYIFCHLFSHNFRRSYYYFRRPCLIFLGLACNYTSFRFLLFIRIFCCMPSNCVSWVLRAIFVYFLSSGRRVVIPWDFFLCWIFCWFVIFTVGWSFIETNVLFMTTTVNFRVHIQYIHNKL